MYCCPGWDTALLATILQLDTQLFLLSGTLIEPTGESRMAVKVQNFGTDAASFQEASLLEYIKTVTKHHFNGTAQPTILTREWWVKVGGYSPEFSPGMGSDYDLMMKLWFSGCRVFQGVGDSLVYHFKQKTTGRIKPNNSRIQFMRKWGISTKMFDRYYLRSGTQANQLKLPEPVFNFSYYWSALRLRCVLFYRLLKGWGQ